MTDSIPAIACSVYKSGRKEFTYLFLPEGAGFDDVPEALMSVFGKPEFVISLELSPDRELAQEDIRTVMENLAGQGFHLQLPPGESQGDLL